MIRAEFIEKGLTIRTKSQYMYDKGVQMQIVNAPEGSWYIDFGNGITEQPINDAVMIPDSLFLSGNDVEAYIVCLGNNGAVNTITKIIIPVNWRPARGEEV